MTKPRLPRHRPSPGQLVLRYHLQVLDGGGRTDPSRAQLRVLPGGRGGAPAPEPAAPVVALRKRVAA